MPRPVRLRLLPHPGSHHLGPTLTQGGGVTVHPADAAGGDRGDRRLALDALAPQIGLPQAAAAADHIATVGMATRAVQIEQASARGRGVGGKRGFRHPPRRPGPEQQAQQGHQQQSGEQGAPRMAAKTIIRHG